MEEYQLVLRETGLTCFNTVWVMATSAYNAEFFVIFSIPNIDLHLWLW